MAEREADGPTFWLQASGGDSSAFFLLLLILYLAASVTFVLLALPAFLTLASQFFGPRSVNKSCDSLNIVLVLLAIVCVLLGRSNSGGGGGSSGSYPESRKSSSSSSSNPGKPYKRYGSDDLLSSEGSEYGFSRSSSGRMRTSSSCPDPRTQDSPSDHGEGRWRFYDDTHLVAGRGFGSEPVYSEALSPSTVNYESSDESDSGSQLPRIPTPLPPPPPPFEVQPWEVIVRGDYAWIKRTNSWPHADTKDFEEASVWKTIESPSNASLGATSPECCRIPDVNKRADNFIADIRTRWNREAMNSMKQRRSNLAPERKG